MRNYNSLESRKLFSDSSHHHCSTNNGDSVHKKRCNSKKRASSASKNSQLVSNGLANILEKNKSCSNYAYIGARKLSQSKKKAKNLTKGSPYFSSLNPAKVHSSSQQHSTSVNSMSSPENKVKAPKELNK